MYNIIGIIILTLYKSKLTQGVNQLGHGDYLLNRDICINDYNIVGDVRDIVGFSLQANLLVLHIFFT